MNGIVIGLVFALAFVTASCQRGTAAAQADRGVPIEEPVAVEAAPFLTIGSTDGDPETEFFGPVLSFPLPEGRIAVAFWSAGEIRIFDSNGKFVRTLGRPGEGPGEFRALTGAWTRGDTVEAYDRRLRRITRFRPDGTVETVTLDMGRSGFVPGGVVPGVLDGGWLMIMGTAPSQTPGRIELRIGHFASDGTFRRILAQSGGPEVYSAMRVQGPVPLSPNQVVVIREDRLYLGDSALPEIRVITESGSGETVVRWQPRNVPPKEAQQAVVRLAVERAAPEAKESVRLRLEAAPEATSVPTFSTFLVDDLGYLWVRPFEPLRDAAVLGGAPIGPAIGGEWWVFDADGDRIGAIELPPDLSPHYVTANAVLGARQDELGFRFIQVHRVIRRPPTEPTGKSATAPSRGTPR